MEFRALKVFVEVAREGSFSKAAQNLFITQSTVSKAIKQLEEELGISLIERFKNRNVLTFAGEIVFKHGIKLLTEREDLLKELDELRGLKQGILRLGISPVGSSTLFAPLFASYRKRYPGIDVELVEHGSDKLEELLRAGDIDFAGTLLPIEEEFDCQPICSEPLVALVSANHPLKAQQSISLSGLREIPFILFASGFALHRIILDACHIQGFEPKIVAQSSQIDFMLELVASGLGVAFLPQMIAFQRKNRNIHALLIDDKELQWNMVMSWRRYTYLSEAAKVWLGLVREAHGE